MVAFRCQRWADLWDQSLFFRHSWTYSLKPLSWYCWYRVYFCKKVLLISTNQLLLASGSCHSTHIFWLDFHCLFYSRGLAGKYYLDNLFSSAKYQFWAYCSHFCIQAGLPAQLPLYHKVCWVKNRQSWEMNLHLLGHAKDGNL